MRLTIVYYAEIPIQIQFDDRIHACAINYDDLNLNDSTEFHMMLL